MIKSYMRGWEIYFDNEQWRYCDDNTLADDSRPCKRCGHYPTKEGYDYCLGHINNATSACCGHGATWSYILYKKRENE